MHFILKRILKVQKISVGCVPHILTVGQKQVQTAKQLLKMFKFSQRQFTNIVTGDKTWVQYFKPVINIGFKIWLTKLTCSYQKKQKHKEDFYYLFFSCGDIAVQIPETQES